MPKFHSLLGPSQMDTCFFLLPYENWDSLQNPSNAVEADGWMENRAYTASHFTKFVFVVVVFLQF